MSYFIIAFLLGIIAGQHFSGKRKPKPKPKPTNYLFGRRIKS